MIQPRLTFLGPAQRFVLYFGIAMISYWSLVWCLNRPKPAAEPTLPALSTVVVAYSDRPWAKLPDGPSFFAFTDGEWSALTNAFRALLQLEPDGTPVLHMPQGVVRRYAKPERISGVVSTNPVWFVRDPLRP